MSCKRVSLPESVRGNSVCAGVGINLVRDGVAPGMGHDGSAMELSRQFPVEKSAADSDLRIYGSVRGQFSGGAVQHGIRAEMRLHPNPQLTDRLQRLNLHNGNLSDHVPGKVFQPYLLGFKRLFLYQHCILRRSEMLAVDTSELVVLVCRVLAGYRVAPSHRAGLLRITRFRVNAATRFPLYFDCAVLDNHSREPLYP